MDTWRTTNMSNNMNKQYCLFMRAVARIANIGGDCGSAKHEAIGFYSLIESDMSV